MMFKNGMRPVHPGEILKQEYLVPLNLSASALARALHVPPPRINDIVRQRRGITADTAIRLARHFGTDAQSWLILQSAYDLRTAEIKSGKQIEREVASPTVCGWKATTSSSSMPAG
jgi:addiction module HigA family antidote